MTTILRPPPPVMPRLRNKAAVLVLPYVSGGVRYGVTSPPFGVVRR